MSFDINYGQNLPKDATVDYDSAALKKAMEVLDIPESEHAKTHIALKTIDEGGVGGLYRQDDNGNHEVQVSPLDPETTNQILQHELQHLADSANNESEVFLYNPFFITVNRWHINQSGVPLLPDEAIAGSYATVGLGVGTALLASVPKIDRLERRTRKAEKLNLEPIIKVQSNKI